jgi:hypothetical protein
MAMKQLMIKEVAAAKTINGVEMGVLADGTAFLTGRSLARLCGVAISSVIEAKDRWNAGNRDSKLAKLLMESGFDEQQLAQPVKLAGVGVGAEALAYNETVVMAFLEHCAYELKRPEAIQNHRLLSRAGFRLFVYNKVGYDPSGAVPGLWREFHDRLNLHAVPPGYFSVFREMSDFTLLGIQNGLKVDAANVPDISVGKAWGAYWTDNKLEDVHGARVKHDHNYPDYFPQAVSNPQDMWVYPNSALGVYRNWLQQEYVPKKFPAYVAYKVTKGALPASMAELLLAAVEPMKLTEIES